MAEPALAQLASHRALYQLKLDSTDGDLVAARGAIFLEWEAGCEGWMNQQRVGFVASTAEGGTFDFDVRFSSWERLDGREMNFSMRRFAEGQVVEEYRGRAEMPDEGTGMADYSVPEDVGELELPAGTVFPTSHMKAIIDRARDGDRFVGFDMFDGAGQPGDALAHVTAVIGDRKDAEGVVSWPVILAYYEPAGSENEPPRFQLSFDLEESGVMREMILDYGTFALKATLEQLEMLETVTCE